MNCTGALKPLPVKRYTAAEWKSCRANIDYHVEVDPHYYSVPYQLVGQQLEARATDHGQLEFSQGQLKLPKARAGESGTSRRRLVW